MSHDLAEIAASGATFRLFTEVAFAEPPARVPLLPKPGTYQHPSYGEITLTPERIANFVRNLNAAVYQRAVPIDAEHQSKLSGALGYFSTASLNEDGSADAEVEWTDRGRSLIAAGGFRYVSPEWYDRWTDPATEVEHEDVVVGLALTSRPFFKDDSLRPLVAREGELIAPPKEVMGATETPPDDPSKPKGQHMSEQNESVQMTEEVAKQFRELNDRLAAAEAAKTMAESQAQQFAERIGKIEAERRHDAFVAEVTGKSAANGHRWFGDAEKHVAILEALSDDNRQLYIEQQRAIAQQVKAFAGRELGSDAGNPDGSAEAAIDAKAKALAASKGIPYAQAYTEVMTTDRDLAHRYLNERARNVSQEG